MKQKHPMAAKQYAEQVIAGEIVTGAYTQLACQRFLNDLNRDEFYFDEDAAEAICRFIESLPHVKGKWAAKDELIRLEPWQSFVECNLFGFKWTHNKLRRFRESYEEVARKNAKSTRVAARALFMLCEDDEFGAEVYSGATSERPAGQFGKVITLRRKAMNTFICSTKRPFKFFGRINEDVNTYVSLGGRGRLFLTINSVMITQVTTQQNQSGMTDIYLDGGTYIKSFYSILYNPSCVKIAEMGQTHRRIHHRVNWRTAVPKIMHQKYQKAG